MQLCFVEHCSQILLWRHLESNWRCAPSSRNPTLLETLATPWDSVEQCSTRRCPLFHWAKLHRLNGLFEEFLKLAFKGIGSLSTHLRFIIIQCYSSKHDKTYAFIAFVQSNKCTYIDVSNWAPSHHPNIVSRVVTKAYFLSECVDCSVYSNLWAYIMLFKERNCGLWYLSSDFPFKKWGIFEIHVFWVVD